MTLESDVSNDLANAKAWIQREETVLAQDADDAYNWLKAELLALEPEVAAMLKAAVGAAVQEALGNGATLGTVVADTLTILARDGAQVLAQVKSEVVTAVVGLTASPAA